MFIDQAVIMILMNIQDTDTMTKRVDIPLANKLYNLQNKWLASKLIWVYPPTPPGISREKTMDDKLLTSSKKITTYIDFFCGNFFYCIN